MVKQGLFLCRGEGIALRGSVTPMQAPNRADVDAPRATVPLTERTVLGLHTALIQRLPTVPRDAPILDVGCGTGAWLERLADAGYTNLHGVDQDLGEFRCSRAVARPADLDQDSFPFAGTRFRLITAIEVIEHLENPGRLYRLAQEHLADDGQLLLTSPNIHSLTSRVRHLVSGQLGQFDAKGDPTHIAPLLLTAVERIAPRHGLRIVSHWGYPESGSLVYGRGVRWASSLLSRLLPDDVPGDILCVLLDRRR
jgi:2-polyprenyl-3-methyl-5-hydroxy-6-metoxy-1,4-benzoquinol methylase